ncbi:GGDEF domain-containing protein [Amycolatopsis cynarae]|uniref:GGDEF domain-containing protein n=1 Tax=Amycolatopsis cynarae TaxID=2995223 RepID=UPI003898FC2B
MNVTASGGELPRQKNGPDGDLPLRTLRARWRAASLAAGWRFPSDWALPEVDAVCAAVLCGAGPEPSLAGLARARAAAGAELEEVFADLAALQAVLAQPDSDDGFVVPDLGTTPARLITATALAWADAALDQIANIQVIDPLTGLPTAAYLRTRLDEFYRGSKGQGRRAADEHTLLVVSLDLTTMTGWRRVTGMILVAEAMRAALDGGESLATLGPSTSVAVLRRDDTLPAKAVLLRRALHQRLSSDASVAEIGKPRIRLVRLPATHESACDLLRELGRA